MSIVLTAAGTACGVFAIILVYLAVRVARSSRAIYEMNRVITGSFSDATAGRIKPPVVDGTDFRVKHFAQPKVSKGGGVAWERAGSLSDEAVDSVLLRQG